MIAPVTTPPPVAGYLPYYKAVPCYNAGCRLIRKVHRLQRRARLRARTRNTRIRIEAHRKLLWDSHPYCCYCGGRVGRRSATLDHAIPRSRGGTDDLNNLVLACRHCNEAKADRTPREYALAILRNVRRLAR